MKCNCPVPPMEILLDMAEFCSRCWYQCQPYHKTLALTDLITCVKCILQLFPRSSEQTAAIAITSVFSSCPMIGLTVALPSALMQLQQNRGFCRHERSCAFVKVPCRLTPFEVSRLCCCASQESGAIDTIPRVHDKHCGSSSPARTRILPYI